MVTVVDNNGSWRSCQLVVKRVIDIIVSATGLVFLSRLFLIVSLAIKLDSPGPIFAINFRHCYDSRIIPILVFRCGSLFHAPTAFGRLMARVGLDRLPMLFNVLRGDMSLVGPRCGDQTSTSLTGEFTQLLAQSPLRPGIISPADILAVPNHYTNAGRQQAERDMVYIMNWSLALDAKIIFGYLLSKASYLQS
jgi:lipopolysaccharide/colanic/teichoic acid biosynthesis glycosyltransferase